MTPLKWWGSRRTVETGHVVTVVMQDWSVVDVKVDESPSVEIRRLAGMVAE